MGGRERRIFKKNLFCVCLCPFACMCTCLLVPMEGVRSPGTDIAGAFELPDVDAVNQTRFLCRDRKEFITTELSLYALGKEFFINVSD